MRRYSFLDTIVIVNGVELTGWADGDDVIDIDRRQPSMSDKVGADGEMMVSVNADKSGSLKFKLQQTSPSNEFLTALVSLQEASGSTFIPVFVKFQDCYRNDMAIGSFGYITKPAGMKRGAQGNSADWEVVVERLDLVHGSD